MQARFNKAIAAIRANGTYDRLAKNTSISISTVINPMQTQPIITSLMSSHFQDKPLRQVFWSLAVARWSICILLIISSMSRVKICAHG